MENTIQGCYVALPTPFRAGRVDLEKFDGLIERICELGADGILVAGTTGEVPTLNEFEQRSLIRAAVECSGGRLSVLAGVGSNCTRHSVELTHFATSAGADAVMAITPYYNCPNRRGMLMHFGQIADATDLPVV
ncbi:MAG: 4-hydroxy-tetrahydrodipicolinate synthase, partial [Candidatus Paceibacteria bacterium]